MCHGLWYGVDDVVDDDLSTESLLFTEAGRLRDLDVVPVSPTISSTARPQHD